MRAVAFKRSLGVDDPAALIDVELPRPSAVGHDILVEVHAVSVNPVDYKIRGGGDPDQARVLGFDAAETVVEVGDRVSLFQPGDEVWYAGNIARPGTNSELHLVDERIVSRKPASLSFSDAAAMPLTVITAWEGLFDKLKLTSESRGTLYVAGASGGVGSMVLQLAEALLPGVRVIATSSRPETDRWVRGLGAEAWVNHRADDVREQLVGAAPEGIDWVFTSYVGEPGQLDLYVSILNPFGEIVAIDDPTRPRGRRAQVEEPHLPLGAHVHPRPGRWRRPAVAAPPPRRGSPSSSTQVRSAPQRPRPCDPSTRRLFARRTAWSRLAEPSARLWSPPRADVRGPQVSRSDVSAWTWRRTPATNRSTSPRSDDGGQHGAARDVPNEALSAGRFGQRPSGRGLTRPGIWLLPAPLALRRPPG